tara:strand:+ start:248 stop:508 length:261 start_codon:yes stop_codon:yes gene_type:complete
MVWAFGSMNKQEIASLRLWYLMPLDTTNHFAKQQGKTPEQVCLAVVTYDQEWADRVTQGSKSWSLDDLRHDFIGLVNKDEHFVPRL